MKKMSAEAIEARREYKRRWYEANKEHVQEYNVLYWERKAAERKQREENK